MKTRMTLPCLAVLALISIGCGRRPIGSRDGSAAEVSAEAVADRPVEIVADRRDETVEDRPGEILADRPDETVDDRPDAVEVEPDIVPRVCPPRPAALAAWEDVEPDGGAPPVITFVSSGSRGTTVLGTADGRVFEGASSSATPSWKRVDQARAVPIAPTPPALPVSASVLIDAEPAGAYLAHAGGAHIWTSSAMQRGWRELLNSPGEVWNLSVNPRNFNFVYAVTRGQGTTTGPLVWVTSDGGNSWSQDFESGDPLTALSVVEGHISTVAWYVVPGYEVDNVWAGTTSGEVAYTSNVRSIPQTWKRSITGGRPARPVLSLAVVPPANPNEDAPGIYVTYESLDSDGIFYSSDGGVGSWRNIHNAGLPQQVIVYSVSVNPIYRGTLYAFTSEGAFRSDDAGDCWSRP